MYSYVSEELPALVATHFPLRMDRQGVFGHSMGGHGALIMALKHADRFRSCSAFAPMTNPSAVEMPATAFSRYLGDEKAAWRDYDAVALIEDGHGFPEILVETRAMPTIFSRCFFRNGWKRPAVAGRSI